MLTNTAVKMKIIDAAPAPYLFAEAASPEAVAVIVK